ncbi:MAG: hypothetical protein FJW20_13110 [Acidimicrobiia bacterium]|nr:hypothetical protein [Acidimicrobiia bacterium]
MRPILFLFALAAMAQRPVPVDNEWTRVLIAASSPGPKGRLHKHDVNRVMIYLDDGKQRLEFEEGTVKEIPFTAGQLLWDTKGGMHTSQNTGGTTFRIVEVEIKQSGGKVVFPSKDPVNVAPALYKVELENEQVRVLRVKLSPRQRIPEHEHLLPRVVAPLTPVKLRITALDGGQTTFESKPGEAVFLTTARHSEESLLDAPSELIVVELK